MSWTRAKVMGRLEAYRETLAYLNTLPRVPARMVRHLETQVELHEKQLRNSYRKRRRREDQRP